MYFCAAIWEVLSLFVLCFIVNISSPFTHICIQVVIKNSITGTQLETFDFIGKLGLVMQSVIFIITINPLVFYILCSYFLINMF